MLIEGLLTDFIRVYSGHQLPAGKRNDILKNKRR